MVKFKKIVSLFIILIFCVSSFGALKTNAASMIIFNTPEPFKGVDVSSVISLENSGVKFCNKDGKEQDIFRTLKEAGVNTVRVRIWNDPYNSKTHQTYGGGGCDVETAKKIAKRCAAAGLKLLADFHYSDFWADPGKQKAPKAWENYSVEQKADAIYKFTSDTLNALFQTGVDIAMVQVGNETTTGMCGVILEKYNWSDEGWHNLVKLFNAGSRAVRDFSKAKNKNVKVVLHFTNPEKKDNMKYIAASLSKQKADYDVFATSYYPYWHGTLQNLSDTLTEISNTYKKEVMVAETSWVRTFNDIDATGQTIGSKDKLGNYVKYDVSPQGQKAYLTDLFTTLSKIPRAIGLFYWEPAWLAVGSDYNKNLVIWDKYGSGWGCVAAGEYDSNASKTGGSVVENEALFSDDGRPLDSLYVFKNVCGQRQEEDGNNLLENPGFEKNGSWTDKPAGWELKSTVVNGHFDVRAEDVLSGGYSLHFYSEKAFEKSVAKSKVTALEDGIFKCSANLEGSENAVYKLSAFSNEDFKQTEGKLTGWNNWQKPYVEIQAKKGEEINFEIEFSGTDGAYGSADDCSITISDNIQIPPDTTTTATTEPPTKIDEKVKGDVNLDGSFNLSDVVLFQKWLINYKKYSILDFGNADIDNNKTINSKDLTLMKKKLLSI